MNVMRFHLRKHGRTILNWGQYVKLIAKGAKKGKILPQGA